ncbi:hypothetical protein MJO28_016205 [Puccinia striiformis f. sp. tritici]|uniref:Uncharacterized protein n=1 Tax=Puccinia striiformis f. sp. tritici TaxID=168172 RepID=A0ACC0DP58_9BASI|nr:hypothetical protein MJO28_016205 [Puccinia striiformis f. sp. tritici]
MYGFTLPREHPSISLSIPITHMLIEFQSSPHLPPHAKQMINTYTKNTTTTTIHGYDNDDHIFWLVGVFEEGACLIRQFV